MKRLWFVSEAFYPDESGTAMFMTKIAEHMSHSYHVSALCRDTLGKNLAPKEIYHNISIQRIPSLGIKNKKLWWKLLNMLFTSLSYFFYGLKYFRSKDTIFVVTSPPSLPIIVYFLSLFKSFSYIIRVDDLYPDILVASGVTKKNSLAYRVLLSLNRLSFKRAKSLVCIGRDMRQRLLDIEPSLREKVEMITNWGDVDDLFPIAEKDAKYLKDWGLEDKIVVQWAGNMGYPHDMDTILEAITELKDSKKIHFVFIGGGVKRPYFEKEVKRRKLKNVSFISSLPRSEQLYFLNSSHIGLTSLVPGMKGLAVPSRSYNIWAVGKPILSIADPEAEVSMVIEETKLGWVVPSGQANQMVQILKKIEEEPDQLEVKKQDARELALSRYSKQAVLKQYDDFFQQTIDSK